LDLLSELFACPGVSPTGFGWKVRSEGADPAGSVWALNSEAASLPTFTPGACCGASASSCKGKIKWERKREPYAFGSQRLGGRDFGLELALIGYGFEVVVC